MPSMIRESIARVVEGRDLSLEEMTLTMEEITSGQATPAQIASLITALRLKGETVEEITAAARVMRDKAIPIEVVDAAHLRARVAAIPDRGVERVDFHVLLVVTAGPVRKTVGRRFQAARTTTLTLEEPAWNPGSGKTEFFNRAHEPGCVDA